MLQTSGEAVQIIGVKDGIITDIPIHLGVEVHTMLQYINTVLTRGTYIHPVVVLSFTMTVIARQMGFTMLAVLMLAATVTRLVRARAESTGIITVVEVIAITALLQPLRFTQVV